MKAKIIIPVVYQGKQLELKAKLLESRFGYKFKVKVDGGEVVLEPDKEGKYKVAVKPAELLREGEIDVELVLGIRGLLKKQRKNYKQLCE